MIISIQMIKKLTAYLRKLISYQNNLIIQKIWYWNTNNNRKKSIKSKIMIYRMKKMLIQYFMRFLIKIVNVILKIIIIYKIINLPLMGKKFKKKKWIH